MNGILALLLALAAPPALAQSNLIFDKKSSPDYFHNLHEIQRLFVHEHWVGGLLPSHLSQMCANDMAEYLDQLERGNILALQISDSSGRYEGSALLVNKFWLGSKTLCEEVNDQLDDGGMSFNISRVHFSVTQMMIKVAPLYPMVNVLNIGQCLPATCTADDVQAIMEIDPAVLALQVASNRTDARNDVKIVSAKLVPGTYDLFNDYKFYMACAITGLLLALVAFATVYEMYLKLNGYDIEPVKLNMGDDDEPSSASVKPEIFHLQFPANGNGLGNGWPAKLPVTNEPALKSTCRLAKFVLCFAVGSNAKTIFSLNPAKEKSFACIHGLRMFSLIWTILGHTCLMMFTIGANRILEAREAKKFYFQFVANGTYAVDTFFFMSGFLVVALFLKNYKKIAKVHGEDVETKMQSPIQWISKTVLLIFYRYGRLTPIYLLILLYSVVGMKFAYNQTVFPNNPDLIDHITCEKYWWRNVLYINNWFPKEEICMIWSWFLANEMQFYAMAILLLIISLKHFKSAVFMLGLFLVSSWVISASLSLAHGYKFKLILPLEAFDYLYEKPWNRVGAYIIGMITGGIFDHYRTPPKVSRSLNLTLWVVSMGLIFGLVFGFWIPEMPVVLTAFVVSVGRTVWSVALMWVMLSCCWGLAPPINGILSWRAWIPLSRLTYCSYLIHPLLMAIFYHILDSPISLHQIVVVAIYAGTTLLTFTAALFFSLLLEAPMIRVMRLLIKK